MKTLSEIYNEAFAHSHEAGLQAVWDAAVTAVKAEAAAIEAEIKRDVEAVIGSADPIVVDAAQQAVGTQTGQDPVAASAAVIQAVANAPAVTDPVAATAPPDGYAPVSGAGPRFDQTQ